MKAKGLYLLIFFILFGSKCLSQKGDWCLRTDFSQDIGGEIVYKQYENLKFSFYVEVDLAERYTIVERTKCYIKDNLALLNESQLNDSIDIILARNRNDMTLLVGAPISGMTYPSTDEYIKQKTIICIGGEKNPLKHELMHMVSMSKWGVCDDFHHLSWLMEGLATYADPEAECDNYSFGAKYAYFIQNNKLIDTNSLIYNFDKQHPKMAYNQSAHIVEYLIRNYGIEKLKQLWISKMNDFSTIYTITFDEMIEQINIESKGKYKDVIELDWGEFEKMCY